MSRSDKSTVKSLLVVLIACQSGSFNRKSVPHVDESAKENAKAELRQPSLVQSLSWDKVFVENYSLRP